MMTPTGTFQNLVFYSSGIFLRLFCNLSGPWGHSQASLSLPNLPQRATHSPGPHFSLPGPSAPAPETVQHVWSPASHSPALPVPSPGRFQMPWRGLPWCPPASLLLWPTRCPGSSSSAPSSGDVGAMGHGARKNYWVKNWERQRGAVRKNQDINKRLSIWLLGLYNVSFHLHGITPSPSETGGDWVSVTQGSSHRYNSQNIPSCNMPPCNFADEIDYLCCQPPSALLKFNFMVQHSLWTCFVICFQDILAARMCF